MIYSLKGKIEKIDENTIVVDTGEVCFEVTCSSYTAEELSKSASPQTVLTYLQVREDALCLFGFRDSMEKYIFGKLILVSGVGPKMAISILSGMPLDDLISAITSSDTKALTSIKGLGKKTAERIALELCSALEVTAGITSDSKPAAVTSAALPVEVEEAAEVLFSTGIQKNQALILAKENYKQGMTSEELVVACFKNLK